MKRTVEVVVVNDKATIQKRDGGTYKGIEFIYKDNGDIRTKNLHEKTKTINPAMYKELISLTSGDSAEITMEKKGDFWNLLAVNGKGLEPSTPAPAAAPSGGFSDAKQDSICFQNAMAHATAISIHNAGKAKVEVEDVIALAKRIATVSVNPQLTSAPVAKTATTKPVVEDDDIPFGA